MQKIHSANVLGARLRLNSSKNCSNRVPFTAGSTNPTTLNQNPNVAVNDKQDETQKNQKKWTGRKILDVATMGAYALFIGTALYVKHSKTPFQKMAEKVAASSKKSAKDLADGKYLAQVTKGKTDPEGVQEGNWVYKLFSWFNEKKEASPELTNNLIYGFGTLAIMPLVIMFSPFGKKDASKEDRMFTILRQPISFATVFALQFTFEKLTKNIVADMNKYKLLDGVKVKNPDGTEKTLICDRKTALKNIKDYFTTKIDKSTERGFHFDPEAIKDEKTKEGISKAIGLKDGEVLENNFRYRKFMNAIDSLAGGLEKDKELGVNTHKEAFERLEKLLSPYIEKDKKVLTEHLENLVYASKRSDMVKNLLGVGANSVFSQALGIMMLNFIYGKIMKKRGEGKASKQLQQNELIQREIAKHDAEKAKSDVAVVKGAQK